MIQEGIVFAMTQLWTDNLPQLPGKFHLLKGLPSQKGTQFEVLQVLLKPPIIYLQKKCTTQAKLRLGKLVQFCPI